MSKAETTTPVSCPPTHDIVGANRRPNRRGNTACAITAVAIIVGIHCVMLVQRALAATCFKRHQCLVSNILASAELAQGSWIRYAAALEYVCGFNYDNRSDKGFSLSTNMLANLAATPIDMGHTNYWDAMARLMKCSSLTLPMALKLNAAITLAEQNRWSEVGIYTNGMPHSAIEVFMDELR